MLSSGIADPDLDALRVELALRELTQAAGSVSRRIGIEGVAVS